MSSLLIVPISGFPGYGVTEDGRVWSCKRGAWHELVMCRNNSVKHNHEGYPKVKLYNATGCHQIKVHHIVAEQFIGQRPDGCVINHIDGNKAHNTASNLEYVTVSQNNLHAYATGLKLPTPMDHLRKPKVIVGHRCGERMQNHKLTAADVVEIRSSWASGNVTQRALALRFHVAAPVICRIVNGLKWRHVGPVVGTLVGPEAGPGG